MTADLSKLFLPSAKGVGIQPWSAGVCTLWDPITHRSTVVVGGVVTYTNLPVLNVSAMTVGNVLLALTAGGPIILGPLTVPT